MRGAAMSLTAAAGGFVVLLLTVPVVQGQNGWAVNCDSYQMCALEGSTVNISCSFYHPSTVKRVDNKFWFTKESNGVHVDLRSDPEYSGRVQYHCGDNTCTLRISNLRESDSAEYKFRFITNQPDGKYSGSPGVTLSVTGLQVHVKTLTSYQAQLECHSSCRLPGSPSYIWYKNGVETTRKEIEKVYFSSASSYSCAVEGHESSRSPQVLVKDPWGVTYTSTQICAFKGSTVDMHCSYRYPPRLTVTDRLWYMTVSRGVYGDLRSDPEYSGRVQYHCEDNTCTLRISNLRESDTTEYKFRFITDQPDGKYSGSPGVTLSVTDPQLEVHVRRSTVNQYSNWTELTCHNKCQLSDQLSYIWYNNGQKVGGKEYFHLHTVNPADRYSCAVSGYEGFPSPSVYAPRLPSVSVSPSADLMEDSSMNLTCSSDANPAANYTWYKMENNAEHKCVSEEAQLIFRSIQSSDSGEYYCTAENELGMTTSEHIFVDVKYAPRLPSVSVSPSGEIVEGSSVTLTCSSDANPAANYTWYKENQTLIQGPEGSFHFNSISSEDRGNYYCKSENQHGQISSCSLFLDIYYPPKPPSVSVSPSGEIVEGSSVTLTCSSDANPAANYTWYKENEDSPKASGQNFTITDFRSEHSGNYYCEARNKIGRHSSTMHLTLVAGFPDVWKSAVIGTASAFFVAVILLIIVIFPLRRKKRKQLSEPGDQPVNREQCQSEERDDIHYASIHFSKTQTDPVYSNIRQSVPQRLKEEEEDAVEYSVVNCNSSSTALRTKGPENGEDPAAIYSAVKKTVEFKRNI